MAIIGKGKLFSDDYKYLSDGIRRIKGHILGAYSHLAAESQSCHTAYLIASIFADKEDFTELSETSSYIERTITHPLYSKLNHVKRGSLNDFAYLYEAIKMFEGI